MEAMGTGTEGSSFVPVEIEEADSVDSEVLSSWIDDTVWLGDLESELGVVGSTDNEGIVDSGGVVSVVVGERELNTGELVIGDLEVVEADITDFLGNGTVSSVLPTGQVVEISSNGRVLPEWVRLTLGLVVMIVGDGLARVLSWDHVVENTETVSSARVSMIVSELSDSLVLWAHVGIGMWSNGVDLKIIPVTITI